MTTNKIVFKIQEDASREIAIILAAAKNRADASAKKIIEEAWAKVEQIQAQAELDAQEAARRQELIAELEARKNSLDSKRQVLEEAYALAEKELSQLTGDKWEKLIIDIVLRASETGTGTLCVPAKDFEKYQNSFLAKINAALAANGKKGELTLTREPAKFDGGFLLIGENSDVDCSFATVLREVRKKTEREVAAMLFGTEVEKDASAKL